MRIWCVTREYAGLGEAGGVKNVTRGLCRAMQKAGYKVVLFIPLYKCTKTKNTYNYTKNYASPICIKVNNIEHRVFFDRARIEGQKDGIKVIFVRSAIYSQKHGVYTYTKEEEKQNPNHKKGTGYEDALTLDVLFQKAVAAYWKQCFALSLPDIIHCHDATCALLPSFILQQTQKISFQSFSIPHFIVTIHNAGRGYHHEFRSLQEAQDYTGLDVSLLEKSTSSYCVEPFLVASNSKAILTTVSARYAKEVKDTRCIDITAGLSQEFSKRKIDILGIENGIDFSSYDTKDKAISLLPYEYDPIEKDLEGKYKSRQYLLNVIAKKKKSSQYVQYGYLKMDKKNMPCIFCFHSRLVEQKGIKIMMQAIRMCTENKINAIFLIMGQGDSILEKECQELCTACKGQVVFFCGYDRAFSRLTLAASDFLLLPSIFEPCGMEDLIANALGTIPVASFTGGLSKIVNGQTGFLYSPNDAKTLFQKIQELTQYFSQNKTAMNNIIQKACYNAQTNFSWDAILKDKYLPLFKKQTKNS